MVVSLENKVHQTEAGLFGSYAYDFNGLINDEVSVCVWMRPNYIQKAVWPIFTFANDELSASFDIICGEFRDI